MSKPTQKQLLECWASFEELGTEIMKLYDDTRLLDGPISRLLHSYRNMCIRIGREWPKPGKS